MSDPQIACTENKERDGREEADTLVCVVKTLDVPEAGERRKGSVVSFKDTCDLYEIDLEAGTEKKKPKRLKSLRLYVMCFALIGSFVSTYAKTIINFAIIDMIDPEFIVKQQVDKYPASKVAVDMSENGTALSYFDLDHSCPVTQLERERLLAENEDDLVRARSGLGEKFKWDTVKQGLLKAAFSIGHVPFQLPGSRFAEIYGAQLVLSVACLLMAICCMLAPYLAQINFYLLFADLILMGIWGSFTTPALITLFSNWLTPSEKSLMMSFYLIASRLGLALSSLLCGLLIEAHFSWRNVFFSAAWISTLFAVIFFLVARSRPLDHPLISQLELNYLASKNNLVRASIDEAKLAEARRRNIELETVNGTGTKATKEKEESERTQVASTKSSRQIDKTSAPWKAILTNKPVIAFAITKFCVKLAGDTIMIELPVYLKRVMHFSAKDNGLINAWNYVIFCGGSFAVGAMSNKVNKTRPFNMTKKAIRKLFQCIASFGVALLTLCFAFSVCNNTWTQIFLLSIFFITTFSIGGEAQMPIDLSERYSGTIHALASTLSISGVIEPPLVGFLMRGHAADRDSWTTVWIGTSAISFLGGLVFLILGDAQIQPFENIGHETKSEEKETQKVDENEAGEHNEGFEKETTPEQDDGVRESKQI